MNSQATPNHIWQPFTQMKTADDPVHIVKAKGATLFAADGKTYIDAISSWWVNIHGHANEYIADRIAVQARTLEHVIFAGFTHQPAINLSEKLVGMLPGNFSKIFFSDDGSTSVEVAIKMAIQYWHNLGFIEKTKIIAFEGAYHGDTFGAMSAGARTPFNASFHNLLFEVHHIPVPTEQNFESVKALFGELLETGLIAAFIFEPLIQGAAGMIMHAAGHLDQLLRIAREKQCICIADEVMTGFGRTGRNFAIGWLTQQPEIICLSKGITGGFLPLGVTACSQKIFDAFYADETSKTFFHGHSYTANPIACAAAVASIELLLSENCIQQVKMIADSHRAYATTLSSNPLARNIRQTGTILALDINTPEATSYFNTVKKDAYRYCLENAVLLRPLGNTIYVMPPYCISSQELEKIYETINGLLRHIATRI